MHGRSRLGQGGRGEEVAQERKEIWGTRKNTEGPSEKIGLSCPYSMKIISMSEGSESS